MGFCNGGIGYANYEYGNVPLQGGNGINAIANIIVSAGGILLNSIISHKSWI